MHQSPGTYNFLHHSYAPLQNFARLSMTKCNICTSHITQPPHSSQMTLVVVGMYGQVIRLFNTIVDKHCPCPCTWTRYSPHLWSPQYTSSVTDSRQLTISWHSGFRKKEAPQKGFHPVYSSQSTVKSTPTVSRRTTGNRCQEFWVPKTTKLLVYEGRHEESTPKEHLGVEQYKHWNGCRWFCIPDDCKTPNWRRLWPNTVATASAPTPLLPEVHIPRNAISSSHSGMYFNILTRHLFSPTNTTLPPQQFSRHPILDRLFTYSSNLGTHTFFLVALPVIFWTGNYESGREYVASHINANW